MTRAKKIFAPHIMALLLIAGLLMLLGTACSSADAAEGDAAVPASWPQAIPLDDADGSYLISSLDHLGKTEISTTTQRLCVAAPDGDFVGDLTLYDAADTATPLQTLTFNGETTPFYFTDLASDATYLIMPSHREGTAMFRIVAE